MNNSELLAEYKNKMKYFNYSKNTIEIYYHYVEKFIEKLNKYSQHIVSNDLNSYLQSYQYTSISQQNQMINALKFLYDKVLNKKYEKIEFERPRKEKHLPQIIDKDELLTKISKIENIKHKSIISLAYSTGMRVSEVCNLKIEDIDSKRMLIKIVNGKGRKDRFVPLSQNILELLRTYFKQYRPKEYLFNGQFSLQYTPTSCNAIVKKYLGEKYHFHLLRHSCFTHLLESGTDCRIIQKIAGHSNIKTTEGYTHVSTNLLNKVILPL